MIDFCYVRALLPFAFLVVARLFFPADRRRRVNFVNFRARSDDDEKDDSPDKIMNSVFAPARVMRAFEREFTREAVARDSLNSLLVSSSVGKRSALS